MLPRLAALATALLVLTACSDTSGSDSVSSDTQLETAYDECDSDTLPLNARVEDGGETLLLEGIKGGKAFDDAVCVLTQLDTPSSTTSKIDSTTALMGRQSDTWDDYEASWTYSPDAGLDMIVELAG